MIAVAAVALLISLSIEADRLIRRVQGCRYWAMLNSLSEKRLLGDLAGTQTEIAQCKDPVEILVCTSLRRAADLFRYRGIAPAGSFDRHPVIGLDR
jgi:hypothetical protein